MKKYLQVLLSGVLFLGLTIYDSSGSGRYLNGEKLLKVIQDINQRYHVHFTYDREIVENISIRKDYNPDDYTDVNEALNSALENTRLKYKILDSKYVIIYQDDKKGMESLKKMVNVLQEIIDQKKEERVTPHVTRLPAKERVENVAPAAPRLSISVRGRVLDEKGEGLPGVSILIKGMQQGTTTDANGAFQLEVPDERAVLVFSFVGYLSKEVPIINQTELQVVLAVDSKSLDEVVVVGYGVQRKSDLTGAVTVVDVNQLKKTAASNFGQQLQGKAAGVTVGSQGAPGTPTMIRIRGIGSVNNNGPLYVIDGVSTRNQDLNSINPNDIESIQILKDASSASIYGAQASNGVIIVTTKKGKAGTPRISYDTYVSVTTPAAFYDMLDSKDRIELMWKSKQNAAAIRGTSNLPSHPQFGTGSSPVYPKYIIPQAGSGPYTLADWRENNRITEFSNGTDWYKESTQNAPTQSHQLTLSGANESVNYSFGLNYYNQQGIFLNSYYKRYSTRINTEFNVNKKVRVGENLTVTFSNNNRFDDQSEGNALSWSYRMLPWVPVYDISGRFAGTKANGSGNGQNPVAILERGKDNRNRDLRLFGNIFLEADLLSNLKFRTSFGIDHNNSGYYSMKKLDPEFSETQNRNQLSEGSSNNLRYVWSNTLNFNKTIRDIHSINVLVGSEFIRDGVGRSLSATRYGYLFEDNTNTWTLANGGAKDLNNSSNWNGEMTLFGLFGRVDYSLSQKYLLTAIVRRDGSSRFSESNRYGVFPSISGGWRISQEDFFKEVTWVDDLKLRVGYGVTGNSEIPRITNWADEYVTNPGSTNYDLDGQQGSAHTGFGLTRYGNSNTKWETTKMTNIGADISLFRGALNANIEYYIKNTSDMLVMDNYSSLAGTAAAPYVNLGNMQNKGWDIAVGYKNKLGELGYDVGFNVSTYKNKVVKLNNVAGTRFWGGSTRYGNVTMTQQGSPISQFFGYKIKGFYESEEGVAAYQGVNGERAGKTVLPIGVGADANLIPREWVGKYMYEDVNGDGKINVDDKTIMGNPHSDFTGGFNFGLNYKNFDLSVIFYASVGNEIYNQVKWWTDFQSQEGNRSAAMRDKSWEPGKTNATLPILDEGDIISNKDANSYFVEDGSYLRMQTFSVGYTLPGDFTKRIGIRNCRIYLQANNPFTWTKYTGLDPEITNLSLGDSGDLTKGVDFGRWPQSRQFQIGLNLNF